MCGIAGAVSFNVPDPGRLRTAVMKMCDAQFHRGPDNGGVYASPDGTAALGSRRLAIIDLSPAGHQPMTNEDGSLWITYNGEIYNFRELRADLVSKGHRFSSGTDTEVVLHLYEEYGEESLSRLRGMFAFGIWDGTRQRLFLARDRLGIKPLYVHRSGDTLLFASEVKALISSGHVPQSVNVRALLGYLAWGSFIAPDTIFQGVRALLPGHLLVFDRAGARIRPYWEIECGTPIGSGQEDYSAELRASLVDGVRAQLVSDVPLGVFLSGGVDSSAVVALMRRAGHGKIRTFSLRFSEPFHDEGPHARAVSERFETEHTEHTVSVQEFTAEFERFLSAMDQPSVDGFNTYFVSKVARAAGVIAALTGIGGDELFGGYASFSLVPRLVRWWKLARIPGSVPWLLRGMERRSDRMGKLGSLRGGAPSVDQAYTVVRGLLSAIRIAEIAGPALKPHLGPHWTPAHYLPRGGNGAPTNLSDRLTALELQMYTGNQLLRDTDAMSMAHSLEVRVPLLDDLVVEAALRIPGPLRARDAAPKTLLAEAAGGGILLDAVRRPKRGFTFPLDSWMRGPLRPRLEETLVGGDVLPEALFSRRAVENLWRGFEQGHVHWSRPWALAVLGLWGASRKLWSSC